MVRLELSSLIDQIVMGFEQFDISHYLNTIKTFAKSNFGIGMNFPFVVNDQIC